MEFSIQIANLGKYTAGILSDAKLSFPTTTQQVQEALRAISAAGEARPGGAGKKRNVPCSTREILARAREWLESADQDR